MIRVLGDMPAGVLGFEAIDDVEKEDYENVLVPAINQAVAVQGRFASFTYSARGSTSTRRAPLGRT